MVVDIVFSLDSVITAVGMTPHIPIMIIAVLVAAAMMLVFSGPISDFVHQHPTMKMLALSFLILIGVMLVAEAFGQHIDKGYIYFAMAFSLGVEFLNMRLRREGDAGRPAALGAADRKVIVLGACSGAMLPSDEQVRRRSEQRDASESGHQRAWTRPTMASRGTGPQCRLSELRLRWSPITT